MPRKGLLRRRPFLSRTRMHRRLATYSTYALSFILIGFSSRASASPFLDSCYRMFSAASCLEEISALNPFRLSRQEIKTIKELATHHPKERVRNAASVILSGEGTAHTRWIEELAEFRARTEYAQFSLPQTERWYDRLDRIEKIDPRKITETEKNNLELVAYGDPDLRVRIAAHIALLGGASSLDKDRFNLKNRPWPQKLKDGLRKCFEFLIP